MLSLVFSDTTLVMPSFPVCFSMTLAIGHLVDGSRSSLISTRSLSSISHSLSAHFGRCCSLERYSLDHRVQKCWCIFCTCCHRSSRLQFMSSKFDSAGAVICVPIKKCAGVNASNSFGSFESGHNGLEFNTASI